MSEELPHPLLTLPDEGYKPSIIAEQFVFNECRWLIQVADYLLKPQWSAMPVVYNVG